MFHAVIARRYSTEHLSSHETIEEAAVELEPRVSAISKATWAVAGVVSDTGTCWSVAEALGRGVSRFRFDETRRLREVACVVFQ